MLKKRKKRKIPYLVVVISISLLCFGFLQSQDTTTELLNQNTITAEYLEERCMPDTKIMKAIFSKMLDMFTSSPF